MAKKLITSSNLNRLFTQWSGGNPLASEYYKGQMVLVNGWLMAALVDNDEEPDPKDIGGLLPVLPADIVFATGSNLSSVQSGVDMAATLSGVVVAVEVYVPKVTSTTHYRLFVGDYTDPANVVWTIYENLALTPGDWSTVTLGTVFVDVGHTYRIFIDAIDNAVSNALTDTWTFSGTSNAAGPGSLSWNRRNDNTVFRVEFISSSMTDREAYIMALIPGATIYAESILDSTQFLSYTIVNPPTNLGTYATIEVNLVDIGNAITNGTGCNISFSNPIPLATEYSENALYWDTPANQPTWATARGFLAFDGVDQLQTSNAYGINVIFQQITSSDKWGVMSYSPDLDPTNDGSGTINLLAAATPTLIVNSNVTIPLSTVPTVLVFDEVVDQNFIGLVNGSDISFIKKGTYIFSFDLNTTTASNNERRVWLYAEVWDGANWITNLDSGRTFDVAKRGNGIHTIVTGVVAEAGDLVRLKILLEANNDVLLEVQSFASPDGILTTPSIDMNLTAVLFFEP